MSEKSVLLFTAILVSIARDQQLKQFYFEVTLLNKGEMFIHLLSFSITNFLLKKKAKSSLKLSKNVKLSIPTSSNLKMQRKSKNGLNHLSRCRKQTSLDSVSYLFAFFA